MLSTKTHELLLKILCNVDHKTLLGCQLVCKHWNFLIKDYVWQKKSELMLRKSLVLDQQTPWTIHYFICDHKPFYKNLIKNHSGENGPNKHWDIIENGGNGWSVEHPPQGVRALPKDPVFEDKYNCFVASFGKCWKEQVINLVKEGFSEYMIDHLQPTIQVSEWFCSRPNIPAQYECTIKLLREQKSDRTAIETLNYNKIIEGEQMNHWFKFSHEFKNYGKGLRKIKFGHGGQDRSYVVGDNYGTKMAGACIKLKIRS
ncbi:F-box only protein 2-like isoform X2 [Phymastichus coffea]|uniref:F-box only protein 2-like isoform X2 n=1 Tax=Phymastichus coffea TaxID=108790 RepID=UPI00273CBA8C|nr:F-box only protein 2-like isoform X2 [Phymastichus coffea]